MQFLSSIEKNQIEGSIWSINVVILTRPDLGATGLFNPRVDPSRRSVRDPNPMDGQGRVGPFSMGRLGGRTRELACEMGRAGQAGEQ